MLSEAASYVTDRITETVAERWGARLAWGAAITIFVLAALEFALVALYATLAPVYGRTEAAALICAGSFSLAIVLAFAGWGYRKVRRAHEAGVSGHGATFAAVDEEARDAVDFFGAARVIATAFMFGFTAARKLKT